MKMYIGNCTQQNQRFLYRVPEDTRKHPLVMPIRAGAQVVLPLELSQPAIDAIVAQHAPYGMVRADEIDRSRPFIGLCYSIGKEIPVNKLRAAIVHNEGVLVKRGEEIRDNSAVALNQAIETRYGRLNELELSVIEENPDQHQGETDTIHQTVTVTRDAPEGKPVTSKRKGSVR